MPLSTFLPDVGAVKWQASVSADMPMCHGCLHVNILPLHLFCSEHKEKRHRSSCEDVAVGHASNMPEAETFL